jgi:hypothetical protein
VYIDESVRCLVGAVADPLSARAVSSTISGSRFAPRARSPIEMAALWIILFVTIGLAIRAGTYSRAWSPADSESAGELGLLDTCARTFVLVLLSLIGLLALGVMYGNVLGSASANH